MSFWDGAKSFGKSVANDILNKGMRLNEYKMEYESLSDDELMDKMRSTRDTEKRVAIQSILKDRGRIH